jgi:hypothetical protein
MSVIVEFLGSLSAVQLGVGMAVAAAAMAIVLNWRLALYGMLVQYLFVSLLLNMVLPGGLALVKLVAGVVACVTLYWTGWRIDLARHRRREGEDAASAGSILDPLGLPFRLLALVFAVLVALYSAGAAGLHLFPADLSGSRGVAGDYGITHDHPDARSPEDRPGPADLPEWL